MLCAGLSFFQDRASLQRCLDSLVDFDLVLAIDGRYTGYPADTELSDDGSRGICMQYPNVRLIDAPCLHEYEKRTVYLQHCPLPRIIAKPREFQYYRAHCVVRQQDGRIFRLHGSRQTQVDGVTLCMNDDLRTQEYGRAWQQYLDVQVPLEKDIKNRY